ncbi:MAG: peptidylprolyl isomerase [Candidatus Levybacteria bacterium]|nr:peptidylprolyl isomerase [Candidatus Levybacteria bacterium]
MNKFILVIFILILGFFAVLVLNNKSSQQASPAQKETLAIPSKNPTPTPSPTVIITPMAENPTATSTAIIKTSKGDITLSLFSKDAPNTVNNFVQKAKSGFYNNLTFHRVEDWVVQGGDPLGNGTGGGNMPVEFNNKPFVVGSLGIASRGDGKVQNDAQFFITKKDSQFLNGQYTNFGIITKGMDVVNKLQIGSKILGITIE